MNNIIKSLFTLLIVCSLNCFSQQGINNLWIEGYGNDSVVLPFGNTDIDFFNGNPTITYNIRGQHLAHTHCNISDSLGNLKFYTNGYDIFDASDSVMLNGDSISPSSKQNVFPYGLDVPQANLVIPNPTENNKYYLFQSTNDAWAYRSCLNLMYSEIDMTLNNGLGAVTANKNVILINDSLNLGKIAACKHGNGRDWWVICMRSYSNIFYKLLVTPYGISAPDTQAIGQIRKQGWGELKFSSGGTKLGYAQADYVTNGHIELFDFDRCSGLLSNAQHIIIPQGLSFGGGIEFSPNESLAYVTNADSIYQFDLYSTDISNSRIIVSVSDGYIDTIMNTNFLVGFMNTKLAPDGKIYITSGNSTHYMSVIDQPDSPGLACNVMQHALQLPALYFNTLPNHPNYFLGANGLCNNLSYESLESGKVKKVTVFGNPTHDKFTLWFPVDKDVGVLEIYDVNGECIRREYVAQWSQYKTVDISNLSEGVYYCRMRWQSGEGSVKVVMLK